MMVRALGYETPDVKQGYPFSYMTVANAIGLRQDTEMMANTDALRGEDAQVIYNALFVDYAKGAKMINTTHGTSVEKYRLWQSLFGDWTVQHWVPSAARMTMKLTRQTASPIHGLSLAQIRKRKAACWLTRSTMIPQISTSPT